MVSYLGGGGSPSIEDARLLARRLASGESLAEDVEALIDLDRDGAVTATDLLPLLRAAHGDLALTARSPRLQSIEPSVVRPGGCEVYSLNQ